MTRTDPTIPRTAETARIDLPPLTDLVDGVQQPPTVALGRYLEDPNTGQQLQEMLATDEATLDRALDAATRVHESGEWASLAPGERADRLDAMAAAMQPLAEQIARLESLATGAPIRQTGMLAFICHAAFGLAAQQLRDGILDRTMEGPAGREVEVHRLPVGPALCLVPWNAPAPMAAHKVASALAAGCPVVLKPSEFAPNGTGLLADGAVAAGLPPGLLQVVHGDVETGKRLVADPRIRAVSFTGGLAGGRAIAAACVPDFRPAQLELGGHNALVVLDDADTATAAAAVVGLTTTLNGQWCRALGRLVLPAQRADEILEESLAQLAAVHLGHSLDPASDMGPIVHSAHLGTLRARLADLLAAGGTPHSSTPLPDLPGNFLAPTLVTGVASEDSLHEIFGPIATVHPYRDEAEAVRLANATPYGLEAYVVGDDLDRATVFGRQLRAGGVKINGVSPLSLNLMAPRPAWGLSGYGDEGTTETIAFFTGQQVVGVENSLPASA